MNAWPRCNKTAKNIHEGNGSHRIGDNSRPGAKRYLPALVALGGGCILAGPAVSLELGDIRVHSTLGQPLRASVAFALQRNEQIHDYCIYLNPGLAANQVPSIGKAALTVDGGTIRVTGRTAVREPLVTLQLTVDCPDSAHLSREYSLFIDPVLPAQQEAAAPVAVNNRNALAERTGNQARPAAALQAENRAPIPLSGSYRVQRGDSLSGIASRISGRTVTIWQAVDQIFAANPDAFIDNDRNLLRAGATLAIPDAIMAPHSAGIAVAPRAAVAPAARDTAAQPEVQAYAPHNAGASPPPLAAEPERTIDVATDTPVASRPAASEPGTRSAAGPQPGDVSLESDGPFMSPVDGNGTRALGSFSEPTELIPATNIENAVSTQARPDVGDTAGETRGSLSWLILLGGSGIALLVGLIAFGRRIKESFGPALTPFEDFGRRRTDSRDNDETDVSPILGLPAEGTAAVARRVNLDADLDDGSGFQYGGDIDIAQDFGFSDVGKFDSGRDPDISAAEGRSTDVIAPRRVEEATILVSETPPRHDDTGTYHLSMIVDATKQSRDGSEASTKDLRAIQVEASDDDSMSREYTLSKEVDYQVLEQDYEDELTATQALNEEISKAARALSRQMGKDAMGDTLSDTGNEKSPFDDVFASADEETSLLPAAVTAGELDETANEEITISVPAAENDPTVEVDANAVDMDTRKKRAS